MLQQDAPKDYVIATGEKHTVREFVELAFAELGITIGWQGTGLKEQGVDQATGKTVIVIDPKFVRPAEVDLLLGDSSKARAELGWNPKVGFQELVSLMVQADLAHERQNLSRRAPGVGGLCYHATLTGSGPRKCSNPDICTT
jgi:GDPmannose 4,6-dehydratase